MTDHDMADINRTITGMELSLKRACLDGPIISLGKYIDDLKSAVEVVNKMKAIIDRLTEENERLLGVDALNDEMSLEFNKLLADIDRLTAKNAALREDKERMRVGLQNIKVALGKVPAPVIGDNLGPKTIWTEMDQAMRRVRLAVDRAAIDEAMGKS